MIKTVALVSLSAGTIGEDFVKHEVNIGLKRLEQFGLNVKIMPHAMKGIEYVSSPPIAQRIISTSSSHIAARRSFALTFG